MATNKDFFKKLVQVANPDAKVSYDERKAAAGASGKPAPRAIDEDRERLQFEMINQAYGIKTEPLAEKVIPARKSAATDTNFFKQLVYVANPEEAKRIQESKGTSGYRMEMPTEAAPAPQQATGSIPLTELKETLKSYGEGLKQGIGGGYVFQTHPTLYGWNVTMGHYLNEDESQPVVEVKASLNPDLMPSRIEVILGVAEGKATKLTVGREYETVADMIEDFGDLAELVMKL